jgi:hypothetical protein
MTQTWSKYDYLCTHCDALIEATVLDSFQPVSNITCTCGGSTALLSVSDATIHPTTTKEEQMESTTTEVTVPDTYNPNLLVTYKVIKGYSDAEYQQIRSHQLNGTYTMHVKHRSVSEYLKTRLILSKILSAKHMLTHKTKIHFVQLLKPLVSNLLEQLSGLHLSKLAEQLRLICFLIMILIMNLNQRLQMLSMPTHITATYRNP